MSITSVRREAAMKRFKKPTSKRKQDGKKSQAYKMKLKSEVEVASKEPMSELEKEILAIQMTESEGKLKRKMHLCSHMEEEVSICRTLYRGKLFLKSESMKLLNEAFQDFSSEISLLDEEYRAMESLRSSFTQRRHFCTEYQKQVDMLNALGAELEMKLLESEKCFDELSVFMKILSTLKETASIEKETYNSQKEEIWRNFSACLLRIQNEVHLMSEEVIHNKDLKLPLLPFSWQALFHSGWLSRSWCESSLRQLESHHNENTELERKPLLQFQAKTFNITCSQERKILPWEKKSANCEEADLHLGQCLHLQTEILHQQNKVKSMKSAMVDLENVIRSLEISDETYFEKSYLLQIVHEAGGLLKHGLCLR